MMIFGTFIKNLLTVGNEIVGIDRIFKFEFVRDKTGQIPIKFKREKLKFIHKNFQRKKFKF